MIEIQGEAVTQELAKAELVERWPAGRTLFTEGDEARGIYLVHDGQVDLVFNGRHGVHKALRTVPAGGVIGLSEVISRAAYDCTGTTHCVSNIGFVKVEDLHRMLEENPSLWLGIAARLSLELGFCWQSMRSLSALR